MYACILQAKLEEQEILMEADKEGLKELYEGRLANLTEELAVAHDKVNKSIAFCSDSRWNLGRILIIMVYFVI